MTDHKPTIHFISKMLLQKERLEIVFSDDSGEHLGADAIFFAGFWGLQMAHLKTGLSWLMMVAFRIGRQGRN